MKHVTDRLAGLQLDGMVHLRQGAPEAMIREELAATTYDLAITGLAVRGWEARWRLRPFLDGLLADATCPLLIVSA
jgi:nucleotide-binding universal stress UspA family protein